MKSTHAHAPKAGFTYAELLIALFVLSILLLAMSQNDLALRRNLLHEQRVGYLRSEVDFAMEDIVRNLSRSTGNSTMPAVCTELLGNPYVNCDDTPRIPSNGMTGRLVDATLEDFTDNSWYQYRWFWNTKTIQYQDRPNQAGVWSGWFDITAPRFSSAVFSRGAGDAGNVVSITLIARQNPAQPADYWNNPEVRIDSEVVMSSMSTH